MALDRKPDQPLILSEAPDLQKSSRYEADAERSRETYPRLRILLRRSTFSADGFSGSCLKSVCRNGA